MDKLWAPWRAKYITVDLKKKRGCVFCKILKEKKDIRNYIISRRKHCYAVFNIYPYNNGHLLIVCNRHVSDLSDLKQEEKHELFGLLEEMKDLLDKTMHPGGYNVGINLGRTAGAGFPGHLHVHLVPRWHGDVNFMPVIGHTKVISQSLNVLYKKLTDENKTRHRKTRG